LKWSTATNWSSGTVPNAPAATALFDGSGYSVVEVDAAFTLGRLTFNPVGSVQTFYYLYPTGSGQLTFDNGTNPGVIESLPGSSGGLLNVILSTPIVIGGTSKTLQINNGSVAPVSVDGVISGTGSSLTINANGETGAVALYGANSYGGTGSVTTVAGGVLRTADGGGLPGDSALVLNGGVFESNQS